MNKGFPFESENFIGERLRELRLIFGFTQADVAKSLNVSRSTYSYYELGVTRPDPATLGRLSVFYNVPVDVFYSADFNLDTPLFDSHGRPHRTTRTFLDDPQRVGDLRPEERSLILLLRSSSTLDARQVLEYLESRLPPEDLDRQKTV